MIQGEKLVFNNIFKFFLKAHIKQHSQVNHICDGMNILGCTVRKNWLKNQRNRNFWIYKSGSKPIVDLIAALDSSWNFAKTRLLSKDVNPRKAEISAVYSFLNYFKIEKLDFLKLWIWIKTNRGSNTTIRFLIKFH